MAYQTNYTDTNGLPPDYQNLGDSSNLAKIDIRSLVVEKTGRRIIFTWKAKEWKQEAKQWKTDRVLKISFPKISKSPQRIFTIANDGERIFTPNENISSDALCTMDIELCRQTGSFEVKFFKKTINFKESNRFCFPPEEEKPAKSSTADMSQDDTHGKIETLVSKIPDIDELLNGKGGLKERVTNLWKDVSPVLDVLRNLKEDSYLKKGFAEQFEKRIDKINSSIKSLEKQHETFGENIGQIKDDYKELSHRIEAVDNVLQSVWPIVASKARILEKMILDHYNKIRDKQLQDIEELVPILNGIYQITVQEINTDTLLPKNPTADEVEFVKTLTKPFFRDFKPIYKRIYWDSEAFLKEELSNFKVSKIYNHLENLEFRQSEPLKIGNLGIPEPDVFYREAADKYLNEVKDGCLEKINRFSSQAYSSLDELRPDLEKFVAHSVFHFLDSTFHKIFKWHETLQSNGRGFDRQHLEQVRSRMLKLCGIQTIEPEVYKSKFDSDVHKELDQGNETRYSDHVILKIVETGYKIKLTGKVLKKCGVKINYNTTE